MADLETKVDRRGRIIKKPTEALIPSTAVGGLDEQHRAMQEEMDVERARRELLKKQGK